MKKIALKDTIRTTDKLVNMYYSSDKNINVKLSELDNYRPIIKREYNCS